MSPEIHNIGITVLGFIYVFSVVAILDYFVIKGFSQDLARKVVHIAAGSWLIFWPLYDSGHWTKYLNITPALLWTILLVVKGFTAKEDDKALKTMTRTGNRGELLKGPLYFTLVMNIMGTFFYYSAGAIVAMGFLGWGDGMAPIIGKRFGVHKYKVLSQKSLEGSLAFLIFGLFGAFLFNFLLSGDVDLNFLIICAVVSVIVEGISPKDLDNLLIPFSILLIYFLYY